MSRRMIRRATPRVVAAVAVLGVALAVQGSSGRAYGQFPTPAAPAYYPQPQPYYPQPQPVYFPPSPPQYAPNLGISYVFEPYFNTMCIRLTAYPTYGSPASMIGLQPGDRIVNLDGLPLNNPMDVQSHRWQTTVQYLHSNSMLPDTATVYIP